MKHILSVLVSLTLIFAYFLTIASPTRVAAHPTYSYKSVTHNGVAFYNLVPFYYVDHVGTGIAQSPSGPFSVVTEANWGSVVPLGKSGYPVAMDVYAFEDLLDSINSAWRVPNNYPYCAVNNGDAYSCGDSLAINQWVFNDNGSARARVTSYVYTYDDFNEYLHPIDYWTLNTF